MTIQYDKGSGEPDVEGDRYWYVNVVLHREGGPAIEWNDGDASWLRWGQRHRLDGPAMDFPAENYKKWYVDDKLHRLDGPAIECSWAEPEWWLNGKKAIEIRDQIVAVGSKIEFIRDYGLVIKHITNDFYEVLLGIRKYWLCKRDKMHYMIKCTQCSSGLIKSCTTDTMGRHHS